MATFKELGFLFFCFIMVANIQFTLFGNLPSSSIFNDQYGTGINSNGSLNIGSAQPSSITPDPLLTSNPNANPTPADTISKNNSADFVGIIANLFFGFSEVINNSGIPSPLNFLFSLLVKIFTSAYLFIVGISIKNMLLGGVSDL